ncbi:transcription factor FapR [Listeria booriae]|uniref:Transcription factor FapR n=1 Tax=Listeria booriae TaxID=1552123 RepID=A0A099W9S2_9LIST|nr:transcription factor FapR [Listeria booriae]KGL41762.1 fatty acid biosynthesis transcriptional regulator [Listeria booriae]MBC1209656.1 transcription factor FapR [Listeria booriae]MBC1226260.1 transcription factor FapR [Listeria booriae]MBC1228923.1 transcription factor FapR [Listeria booriae]MBC1232960.1 transcription factor FapR [Listeria booriae]
MKKYPKKERQTRLVQAIEENPFITDEQLAQKFQVSVQTVRLDRVALAIPELRERIKHVASENYADAVRSLPIEEVIGEIIDIELNKGAISIFEVGPEHVFQRNKIARGHHLFAQANSLATAIIPNDLALTTQATVRFIHSVKEGERVIAKAKVRDQRDSRSITIVDVNSYVGDEVVLKGKFEMYHTTEKSKRTEVK